MTATTRLPSVTDSEGPTAPGHPDGRVLALRCLGIPQVATGSPVSWRSALRRRMAAYWARIRPGTTAELAALVLRMSEDIDIRERMLDAALRFTAGPARLPDLDQARIAARRSRWDEPAVAVRR
jgi:hypothetical protein